MRNTHVLPFTGYEAISVLWCSVGTLTTLTDVLYSLHKTRETNEMNLEAEFGS